MAEKAKLFKYHRAVELIASSADPSTHKRIRRGVRNFDSAVWNREKPNAMLSDTYHIKSTQNPAMKKHLLSTGNKLLAEASRLGLVWGISLRADGPMAHASGGGKFKFCSVTHFLPFTKQFAKERPGRHTRRPLVGSALTARMQEPNKFVSVAAGLLTTASARNDPSSEFSTYYWTRRPTKIREALEIASGASPDLALHMDAPLDFAQKTLPRAC